MKGMIHQTGKILFRALIVLLSFVDNTALADNAIQIGIVKSSDNSYYNKTIQTLLNSAGKAAQFRVVDVQADSDQINEVAESDLIISLGAGATRLVSSRYPRKILISAYLTATQVSRYNLSNQQHLAVLLDQPLLRYLAFSHILLDTGSIGLISFDTVKLETKQQRYLLRHNVELNQKQISQPDDLLASLRQLVKQSDSLLMLPDQRIYNRNSLKGVLLTTYRSRIPVISYSPAHVKSGALGSIYSSPEDIGKHLGDLLNHFIDTKSLPDDGIVFAKYYTIAINNKVAHALNLVLPEVDQINQRLKEVLQ